MALEQDQVRTPNYRQIWRRLTLQSEEGLLTEEGERPLRIREATRDLILILRSMLFDPTLENDPQHRSALIGLCSETCATLAEMGVEKDDPIEKDEDSLKTPLQMAMFAAGLLVGENFATTPTYTAYLLEVQEQASPTDGVNNSYDYKIKPRNFTQGIRKWLDMTFRVERAERLLALP